MEKESDNLNAYVVESENGELVGYATYFYAYYTWIGKSMYMDDLYVKPDFRGKGLGQKLINSIKKKKKKDNCKKVHWQVSSWNKNAIEFYKSIGAKIDDVESNCDYWLIEI